jgi:ribosomal 50S subunit-associated protein YjgA (DUF615 family)
MAKKKFQWVAGEEPEEPNDGLPGRGRSRRKREALAVEKLAGELIGKPGTWASLELEESTLKALQEAVRLKTKGGRSAIALRRHTRYLAGLLRREDLDAIRDRLGR